MPKLNHDMNHTSGGVRELLAISLPMVISCACDTMMMFIDRLFLAKLGPEYMSAAMGGGITCFMFMTFFVGLTGYSSALVAQHLGADQKDHCSLVTTQAFIICIVSFPLILACIPLGKLLFNVSGIAPQQLTPQFEYFSIVMFSVIFGLLRNTLSAFFSGIGRTRIVMVAACTAMIINTGANYILIFGNLGFPAMGIKGAAIGTIIGSFAGVVVLACVYFGSKNREEFSIIKNLRFAKEMMFKLFRLGSSFGIEMLLNIVAFNFMVLAFHSYGLEIAGAVTIAYNWDMVAFIPLVGVEVGVTSLVGRYMGAGAPDVAHKVAMSGLKIAGVYSFAALLVFLIFAEPLTMVFKPEDGAEFVATTAPLAIYMIHLISVYVFSIAVMTVFAGALRGAGDTFWTMLISVFGHWVMGLTVIIMSRALDCTPKQTWVGMVFAVTFLASLFFIRYIHGSWRNIKVVKQEPLMPEIQNDAQINI